MRVWQGTTRGPLLNQLYGCIGLVTQPSDPAATEPEGYICVVRQQPPTCFFFFVYLSRIRQYWFPQFCLTHCALFPWFGANLEQTHVEEQTYQPPREQNPGKLA